MVVMDWLRKITDIIMPIDPPEEEEIIVNKTETKNEQAQAQTQEQNQQQQTQAQNLVESMNARRAAAGGGGVTSTVNVGGNYATYKGTTSRPNLKLIKPPEFIMKVYLPADYSQINGIADDILAHKAAIVNYEYVHIEEQRRICDYIDGVCYAVDGTVKQISERIFLYAPAEINSSDIEALVASARYH